MRSIAFFAFVALVGLQAQDLEDNIPENGTDVYNNKITLFGRFQRMKTMPEKTMKTLKMAVKLQVDNSKKENFGQFFGYIARFKKDYDNQTALISRFQRFTQAISRVQQLNRQYDGEAHFEVNEFADLSTEEFLSQYAGSVAPKKKKYTARDFIDFNTTRTKRANLPIHFDLRDQNVVGSVKNQGSCGSCYIFASLEGVESAYAKKTGKKVDLSVQHLLSCKGREINHYGCRGGVAQDVLNYVASNGVAKEADFPYEGHVSSCKNVQATKYVSGYKEVIREESRMRAAMFEHGSLVVGVDAAELQYYSRGVLSPRKRYYDDINHSVNLVGWGEENGTPYWIMKNSWGRQWGEQGYAKIQRGVNALKVETYVQVAYT